MYHVYILQSLKSHKSYVGMTAKHPEVRLVEHNIGSNNWTRLNGPFKLIYYENFVCKADALLREKFLKSGVGNKLVKIIVKYY